MLTDGQVRRIASEWHGGQASALYALASCGAILPGLEREVEEACAEAAHIDVTAERETVALRTWLEGREERGPVEGWAQGWDDETVGGEQ